MTTIAPAAVQQTMRTDEIEALLDDHRQEPEPEPERADPEPGRADPETLDVLEDMLEDMHGYHADIRTTLVEISRSETLTATDEQIILRVAGGRGSVQASANAWRARMEFGRRFGRGIERPWAKGVGESTRRKWRRWRTVTEGITDEVFDAIETTCLETGEEMESRHLLAEKPKSEPENTGPKIDERFPAQPGTFREFRQRVKTLIAEGILDDNTPMVLPRMSIQEIDDGPRLFIGSCETHPRYGHE